MSKQTKLPRKNELEIDVQTAQRIWEQRIEATFEAQQAEDKAKAALLDAKKRLKSAKK